MAWIILELAITTRGLWASSRRGSAAMGTAWITWTGCDGPRASSVQIVAKRAVGDLETGGTCARAVAAGPR